MKYNKNIISSGAFPQDFLWGAATSGYQTEGNNSDADIWLLEQVTPTVFREKSKAACNSFTLWRDDLDIIAGMHLNSYRFSLEWSRLEARPGEFSASATAHYRRLLEHCIVLGIQPFVTLNHFVSPQWFAAQGGWLNPRASDYFVRYCEYVVREFGDLLRQVITFNEPNVLRTLRVLGLPEEVWQRQEQMLVSAAKYCGSERFSVINATARTDLEAMNHNLVYGHIAARRAIKDLHPEIEVGFTLAVLNDQPVGEDSLCASKQEENYGAWLAIADDADFIGVQNYERVPWNSEGRAALPDYAQINDMGGWVTPDSLASTVRYIYSRTQRPLYVTEHGIATKNDELRASFLAESLCQLSQTLAEGIPLKGYFHWSLLDNYEWVSGYDMHFGLCAVDPVSFQRTLKPSAGIYRDIVAQQRGVSQ
ncbi:TPA: glycoside hydrolase family 1 protein [Klebsiella variicola]